MRTSPALPSVGTSVTVVTEIENRFIYIILQYIPHYHGIDLYIIVIVELMI